MVGPEDTPDILQDAVIVLMINGYKLLFDLPL